MAVGYQVLCVCVCGAGVKRDIVHGQFSKSQTRTYIFILFILFHLVKLTHCIVARYSYICPVVLAAERWVAVAVDFDSIRCSSSVLQSRCDANALSSGKWNIQPATNVVHQFNPSMRSHAPLFNASQMRLSLKWRQLAEGKRIRSVNKFIDPKMQNSLEPGEPKGGGGGGRGIAITCRPRNTIRMVKQQQ